MLVDSEVNVSR